MDAITQGLLGAAAAQALFQKRLGKKALIAGALAGMAADLDVLIHSSANPMLGVTFHRHFTHALIFIPLGALLVALFLWLFRTFRQDWRGVYEACLAGYATHGLLDACTSYGTMLLWPFSQARVSWDCVSLIDPVFSAMLFLGVLVAQRRQQRRWAALALILCLAYLGLGEIQNRRGESAQIEIAKARGHDLSHARVMPTLGNLTLWRSVYRADEQLWTDTIRVPFWHAASFAPGESVRVFRTEDLPNGFLGNPSLKKDWEKFLWFSDGFLAQDGNGAIADMRYSSEIGKFKPLWGILIPSDPRSSHVGWTYFRSNRREAVRRMMNCTRKE